MSSWLRTTASSSFRLGMAAGLLVGVGMLAGTLVTLAVRPGVQLSLPETALHATATHGSDTLAVATGQIDEDMEGLFVLDYLTGELQCAVLNYRLAKFSSLFRTNVMQDLGIDATRKRPNYLMVTGYANFPRGSEVTRPALSVVYVVDSNTGRFAAYAIPWRREMARSGRPQQGALVLLDGGNARTAVIRE